MRFPAAVPEIPVKSIDAAVEYYVRVLGFDFDWGDEDGGIAGISQGDCRMFLTNEPFREYAGNRGGVVVWLNVSSKAEVDALYARWREAGATLFNEPEDKPWNLREFKAVDLDGNHLRVFYDFSRDL